MDERLLTERLISYDTSRPEELRSAAAFVKGWLESNEIEVVAHDHEGLPVLVAEVGPAEEPPSSSTATSMSCPAARSSSSRASRATG